MPAIIKRHGTTLTKELGLLCSSCFSHTAYRWVVGVESNEEACSVVTFEGCTECGPTKYKLPT